MKTHTPVPDYANMSLADLVYESLMFAAPPGTLASKQVVAVLTGAKHPTRKQGRIIPFARR